METLKKVEEIIGSNATINNFDLDTNFFDLGLNSLQLVKVTSKINSEFNIEIRISVIFRYSTIRSLSDYIDTIR